MDRAIPKAFICIECSESSTHAEEYFKNLGFTYDPKGDTLVAYSDPVVYVNRYGYIKHTRKSYLVEEGYTEIKL